MPMVEIQVDDFPKKGSTTSKRQLMNCKIFQSIGDYEALAVVDALPSQNKQQNWRWLINLRFLSLAVPPSVKAVNQLVGAPVESHVTLQCIVEAFPKPLNTWYRNEGNCLRRSSVRGIFLIFSNDFGLLLQLFILLSRRRRLRFHDPFAMNNINNNTEADTKLYHGEKYLVTESMINSFTWQMNLTVKNLHKNDFAAYICSSENALGKSDARIRLQGERLFYNETH